MLVHLWVDERPIDVEHLRGTPFRPLQRGHITPGIVGLAFCTFVMAVAFTEITALENEVNLRLNQTAFGFGVAFSALMVSRLLLQVPLGALSDRIGRKPLVMSGLVLLAPATALLGLVGTTLELTGARVLQGIATAAIAAPAYAMAAELAPAGGEGRQLSFVTMGFGLGIAVGPLLAGGLSIVSFTLPFYVGGLLSLLGAVVVWRIVPETVTVEVRGAVAGGVGDTP